MSGRQMSDEKRDPEMADVATALALGGKDSNDYCKLADFFLANGEAEGAEGAAEMAVTLDAANARAWSALGAARARLKRYTLAVPAFLEALKLAPQDITCWTDLGETYVYLMDFEHAAAALQQALLLDPEAKDPWGRRARAIVVRVMKQLKR